MKISFKIAISVILPSLICTLALLLFMKYTLTQNLLENLNKRMQTTCSDIEYSIIDSIATNNSIEANRILKNIKQQNKEIVYIYIQRPFGRILASTFEDGFPIELLSLTSSNEKLVRTFNTKEGTLYDLNYPLLGGSFGTIHIGYSHNLIKDRINNFILQSLFFSFIVIVVSLMLFLFLTRSIVRNINKLIYLAKRVSVGDFDTRVDIRSKDELELLAKSMNSMANDLKIHKIERLKMEERLKKEEEEKKRKELLRREISSLEKERKRISMEIHDGVMQTLASGQINLFHVINSDKIPEDLRERLKISYNIFKDATNDLRNLTINLRPRILEEVGLKRSIETLLERAEQSNNLDVELIFDIRSKLQDYLELSLFRIIQEAINNVIKHANASFVSVIIKENDDRIELTIEDNGSGFEINYEDKKYTNSFGLIDMKERAESLGGSLNIEKKKEGGTKIYASIPFKKEGSNS
ncbi:putative signal transduction histidine kinase [Thermodesulfobium narugense DSM 14796]|uniref:histidine kinase n=1 Tax=Thermodesulfobium narugense DSM 14796 TaxID=747365 RepID=M1E5U8_9BACT|nr:sensor histidine kinase [Thermodesulfobium narugense]AEE15282.1 putative signal transduction histidine kinase [Thermodesulfobium narugense DSM 14796]